MAAPAAHAKGDWVIGQTPPITSKYTLGKQLGQPGQFGRAVQATEIKTGAKRAVKIINKVRFIRGNARDKAYHFGQFRSEIDVMRAMDHKNIIKLLDVFEDDKELFIVLELCQGGELFDRIKAKGTYSEKDAAAVLQQCFEGIKYMHSKKIAHCDLKPDNFLFLTPADDSPLKIIDFGMSKFVQRKRYFQAISGTPYYVAPEVLDQKYTDQCDVWSLGVVMFVMLFGFPPFYHENDEQIFALVKKGFDPTVRQGYGAFFPAALPCSDLARDLMARLLIKDPVKRMTAAEALEHPWFKGADPTPRVAAVLANLNNFSGQNKFKQAVLNFMSNIMSDSEVDELKKTFVAIDKNGDKKLTVDELKEAMDKWGKGQSTVNRETIETLVKMADNNGDGTLSYEELFLTAVQRKLCSKEERLWETFCKLDVNNDGKISKEEIVQVLGNTVQAQELIKAADTNGDGIIDYDEFLATWADKQAAAVAPASAQAAAKQGAAAPAAAAAAPNAPAPAEHKAPAAVAKK